jgi:hypothetical protein
MEAVCFSETFVSTYKSTRRYNPEQQHRQLHRREKLKCPYLVDILTQGRASGDVFLP